MVTRPSPPATPVGLQRPPGAPEGLRVLGIDPGSRLCGWGIVEMRAGNPASVDNGVFVLADRLTLADRLAVLFERLNDVLAQLAPTEAAVEGIFQHRNARSALVLGHARGVALMTLARAGLTVAEYTPQQVKKAVTGTGRAEKLQIQQVVAARLRLPEPPQADAADAVAIALCHLQHLAFPLPAETQGAQKPRASSRRSAQAALAALVTAQEVAAGRPPPPRAPSRFPKELP